MAEIRKQLPTWEETPPEVRHVRRGLDRFLEERRERGTPEEGWGDGHFHVCDASCKLHDHVK